MVVASEAISSLVAGTGKRDAASCSEMAAARRRIRSTGRNAPRRQQPRARSREHDHDRTGDDESTHDARHGIVSGFERAARDHSPGTIRPLD